MTINERDRRPIPARNHRLSQKFAQLLANRGFSPNAVSVAGLVAGVGSGLCAAATGCWPEAQCWLLPLAAVLILTRLLANMFDGMVAVILKRPNPLGELYNDIPDRLSDAATLIGMGYAASSSPVAGFWAALFALLTAYVRALGKAAGAPSEFCGPMAKQQRMFLSIGVLLISAFAGEQVSTIVPEGIFPGLPAMSLIALTLWVIAVGSAWTSARRCWRISKSLKHVGGTR